MPRFQKRPDVIEADQFFSTDAGTVGVSVDDDGRPFIKTPDRQILFPERGDWLIRDANGNVVRIEKDAEFSKRYEEI